MRSFYTMYLTRKAFCIPLCTYGVDKVNLNGVYIICVYNVCDNFSDLDERLAELARATVGRKIGFDL